MSVEILGLGTATPQHGISQQHAAQLAMRFCCQSTEQERVLAMLYRRSGVRYRHSVVLQERSSRRGATELSLAAAAPVGHVHRVDATEAPVECQVMQSFYPEALGPDDLGPTTAERMQLFEAHAAPLAVAAARRALQSSRVPAERISHLITVCCTGFCAPGVDIRIAHELDLPGAIRRTHVGFMGCHGAINGLRTAQAYAQAETEAVVLLCAVELCSLHQQYGWQPEQIVSNALFADGAAAVVLGSRPESARGYGHSNLWAVRDTGSLIVPDTEELMSWTVRDHGFSMTLSPRVPEVIRGWLRPWLHEWLGQSGLTIDGVGSWAIHPGGPRILNAAADAAGLPREALSDSRQVLADYGNMSSPTVLFILKQLRERRAPLPCVMLAFGPGLTVEAALIGSA